MKHRQAVKIKIKAKRQKRRAIELFADTRFFEKKEQSKKVYNRKNLGRPDVDN